MRATVTRDPEAFRARVEGWLAARHLAEAWRARTGGAVEPATALVLYAADAVVALLRPPAGLPRLARHDEREQLIGWARAFTDEAGATADAPEILVDRRLADDRLFVWDDGGPASLVGTSPPVAGVMRVSLVYTPPAARGRGYASALVAAVSSRAMAAGASQCMLYADRANATSNRIYQAVGYRRVTDARDYAFVRR